MRVWITLLFLLCIFISMSHATTYYIDPTYGSGGNGSISSPYDSWNDVTFAAGNEYRQKRGTTYTNPIYLGVSGTSASHITIGVYGDGTARAVINGSAYSGQYDRGIRFGPWERPDVEIAYVDVSDFEITNWPDAGLITGKSTNVNHCTFANIYAHHNDGNGMYLYEGPSTYPVFNYSCYLLAEDSTFCYNGDHGFKLASGASTALNCTAYNNANNGVSICGESFNCLADGCVAYNNGGAGVNSGGNNNTCQNAVCYNNGWGGINFWNSNYNGDPTIGTILDSVTYGNDSGLNLSIWMVDVLVENVESYGNDRGITISGSNKNVEVRYCDIHDNAGYAIYTTNYYDMGVSWDDANNIHIHHNLIYDNDEGVYVTYVNDFYFHNNTLYNNTPSACDVIFGTDTTGMKVRNTICKAIIGADVDYKNLIYTITDPCFVDLPNRDFHLKPDSPAIESGVNRGYTRDYEGSFVPQGLLTDIGAYEYDCADYDNSGIVGLEDLCFFAQQWLWAGEIGTNRTDFNADGTVNLIDFETLAAQFLDPCPPATD